MLLLRLIFLWRLSTGMVAGALVTGNTVVFKPSHDAPIIGYLMVKALRDGGVPEDVIHFVAGRWIGSWCNDH